MPWALRNLTLSPLVVFLAIVFWGWLWGILGALMAVPLMASFKVVCDTVESLRPVGDLLAGRRAIPDPQRDG